MTEKQLRLPASIWAGQNSRPSPLVQIRRRAYESRSTVQLIAAYANDGNELGFEATFSQNEEDKYMHTKPAGNGIIFAAVETYESAYEKWRENPRSPAKE